MNWTNKLECLLLASLSILLLCNTLAYQANPLVMKKIKFVNMYQGAILKKNNFLHNFQIGKLSQGVC